MLSESLAAGRHLKTAPGPIDLEGRMKRLWVFDNDGTLYDDSAAHQQFRQLLSEHVANRLARSGEEAESILADIKARIGKGSVVLALVREFALDFDDLVENVYLRIRFAELAVSDPGLRETLFALQGPKVILTNNPSEYARKVLECLGIADCFERIFGMRELGFHLKPDSRAFESVRRQFPDAEEVVLCDDHVEHLDEAQRQGWRTFWYRPSEGGKMEPTCNHPVISSFGEMRVLR